MLKTGSPFVHFFYLFVSVLCISGGFVARDDVGKFVGASGVD